MPDWLLKLLSADPSKALDVLSRAVDLLRDHPPLLAAVTKWIDKQAS